jgi:predicted dehydrogenase
VSILRIGILGAARVATYALLAPARLVPRVRVTAIAARDVARARSFAATHDIPRVEADYDALVASAEVDAVYVALPAALHATWTERALAKGKHVLCEKPFASNAGEAERMVRVAIDRGLVLVEAFHWRYHPLADRIGTLVAQGEIGALRSIDAGFEVGVEPSDIRYDLALGGGALMDLGCYPVQWARFVVACQDGVEPLEALPAVARAEAVEGPRGVDVAMTADLGFRGDVRATIHCSMAEGLPYRSWLHARGERGELRVDNPLAPQLGHSVRVEGATGAWTEEVAGGASHTHQLERFAAAALDTAPMPTGGADAIATMRVIDAIYRAAGLSPRGQNESFGCVK